MSVVRFASAGRHELHGTPSLDRLEPRTLLAVSYDLREYFPADPRDTWSYTETLDISPAGTTATLQFRAPSASVTNKPSFRNPVITFTGNAQIAELRSIFRLGPAGLRVLSQKVIDDGGLFDQSRYPFDGGVQGLRLLPVIVEAGDVYTYNRLITGDQTSPLLDTWTGTAIGSVTVNGIESITTDAGTFSALKITWSGAFTQMYDLGSTGTGTTTQVFWLVKNVGIVRYDFAQSQSNDFPTFRDTAFNIELTDADLLHAPSGFDVTGGPGGDIAFRSETFSAANGTGFGPVSVSAGTKTRTFTITNTTGFPLFLAGLPGNRLDVRISGAAAADFEVISAGSYAIPVGGSSSFTVRFNPSQKGARVANVEIYAGDDFIPFSFKVRGFGVD